MLPVEVPEHSVDKEAFVRAMMGVARPSVAFFALAAGVIVFVVMGPLTGMQQEGWPALVRALLMAVAASLLAYSLVLGILWIGLHARISTLVARGLFRPQRLTITEAEIVRHSPVGGTEHLPLTDELRGTVRNGMLLLWKSDGSGVRLVVPLPAFASPADRAVALRHLKERGTLKWSNAKELSSP